jgi:hypothetical protein
MLKLRYFMRSLVEAPHAQIVRSKLVEADYEKLNQEVCRGPAVKPA